MLDSPQAMQANKLAVHDYQIDYLPTLVVAGRHKIGPVNNIFANMQAVSAMFVKDAIQVLNGGESSLLRGLNEQPTA
jgi:hypothetical protein